LYLKRKEEKRKNYEQEKDEESSLILSCTQKTDNSVFLQTRKKSVTRLEKIKITMAFEKL